VTARDVLRSSAFAVDIRTGRSRGAASIAAVSLTIHQDGSLIYTMNSIRLPTDLCTALRAAASNS
jgi:hypothetical protein